MCNSSSVSVFFSFGGCRLRLVLGCLYKELDRQSEAATHFKQIFDISEDIEDNTCGFAGNQGTEASAPQSFVVANVSGCRRNN